MDIQSLGTTPTATQRRFYHETPDSSFYQTFQAAFVASKNPAANHQASTASTSPNDLSEILGETHTRLSALRGVSEASQATYASVLHRAYGSGGMSNARQFLSSLTGAELEAVRQNHCLADPVNVSQLSEEGAENLLLPEGYTVDLNHDGIDEVGAARTIAFPPKDAPAAFKDAWFQATANMDEGSMMSYGLMLHISVYGIQTDESSHAPVYAPDSLSSYQQIVDNYLAVMESQRSTMAPGQYERDKDFFSRLQGLLSA